VLAARLWITMVLASVAALLVGIGSLVFNGRRAHRRQPLWVLCVLLFAAADAYHFKLGYLINRSDQIRPNAQLVEQPSPIPFPSRRLVNLKEAAFGVNRRLLATLEFSPMFRNRLQGRASRGAQYWTNNLFLFTDEAGSTFQVDSWLKPLDQLLRTYWHVPIDSTAFPPGIDLRELVFPLDHPAAGRITGVTADKIRFFSRAYALPSPDALAPLLVDPGYGGNVLFVLPDDAQITGAPLAPWKGDAALSGDDSLPVHYQIARFDSNRLTVRVTNPGAPAWMYYADVWHPSWRAIVNGHSTPVLRANMAYKAVPIPAGTSEVQLTFSNRMFELLAPLLALNDGFWLLAIPMLLWWERDDESRRR